MNSPGTGLLLWESQWLSIIKVFVIRIESGNRNIDDFQLACGTVPALRFDEDGIQRLDGNAFSIEFHVSFAFKNHIDFCHMLVIMNP